MSRILLSLFLFFSSSMVSLVWGQDTYGLKGWNITTKKLEAGKYELQFELPSTQGWQVYAPNQLLLESPVAELKFEDSAIRQQGPFVVGAEPKKVKSALFPDAPVEVYDTNVKFTATILVPEPAHSKIKGNLQYSFGKGDEFYPSVLEFTAELEGGAEAKPNSLRIASIDINNPVADCGDSIQKDSSILTVFLLGFLGGLIALFTPCVFPMIPLTVSFFTNKQQARKKGIGNAVLYGFFIFMIYVLLTIPFHLAGKTNSDIFKKHQPKTQ